MNNQNTYFTDHLKNHINSNSGKKLKTAANVFLFLGILTGLILGIVMFSKAGESKDSLLIGDTASGLFTWLGFGFMFGLSALSIVHYFLLSGLGEAIELIQQQNDILRSQNNTSEDQTQKTQVLINKYGMYCSKCNNYINPGDYQCSRCHSILDYDTANSETTNKPENTQTYTEPTDSGRHHSTYQQGNTPQYMGHLQSIYQNEPAHNTNDSVASPNNHNNNVSVVSERKEKHYQSNSADNSGRVCRYCGGKLKADSKFCPVCGAKAE